MLRGFVSPAANHNPSASIRGRSDSRGETKYTDRVGRGVATSLSCALGFPPLSTCANRMGPDAAIRQGTATQQATVDESRVIAAVVCWAAQTTEKDNRSVAVVGSAWRSPGSFWVAGAVVVVWSKGSRCGRRWLRGLYRLHRYRGVEERIRVVAGWMGRPGSASS